jgi:hypothetical protein
LGFLLLLVACSGSKPSQQELARFCKQLAHAEAVLSDGSDPQLDARLQAQRTAREELFVSAPESVQADVRVMQRFDSLDQ